MRNGQENPLEDGFFVLTMLGPAGNYDRLKAPLAAGPVTPGLEAQLNERQRRILARALAAKSVTRGWCVEFGVANDTAGRDLRGLTALGLLETRGRGRSVRYIIKSTDNRPIIDRPNPGIDR